MIRQTVIPASLFSSRSFANGFQAFHGHRHFAQDLHDCVVHSLLGLVLLLRHKAPEVLNELAHLVGQHLLVVGRLLHGALERAAHLRGCLLVGAFDVSEKGLQGRLN